MRAAAAAVLLLAGCTAPIASTEQTASSLLQYAAGRQQQQVVRTAAQASDVLRVKPCPGATFGRGEVTSVLQTATFDAAGQVTGGAWQERVPVQGCSPVVALNVAVVVRGPGRVEATPLLPGDTHADAVLQADGSSAIRMLLSAAPECQPVFANAAYVGPDGAPVEGRRQGWRERWTIISCARRAVFTVHFTPDLHGGTYLRVNPTETVEG